MHRLFKATMFAAIHIGDGIRTLDMARAAGMSDRHLTRKFKSALGVTPHRYLTLIRLEKAKSLLATTRTPIAQVAVECGFASQSSMTTAFRGRYNTTPARYRMENATVADNGTPELCESCPLRAMLAQRGI